MTLFADVQAAQGAGRGVALATVIAVGGSTPRHLGARMAVLDDGTSFDTIGGGKIELEITRAAIDVAAGGPAVRVRHHLVRDLAMCCGGWMEVVIGRPDPAAIAAVVTAIRDRAPVVLATALADGALTIVDATDAPRAPAVIGDALHERIGGPERAIVFGAGHVGRALTPLLAGLGFEVIVCDDGDTGALATPVPGATQLVEDFELGAIERAIGGLGSGDHVFVVTRDHALDERLMLALIPRPLAYLGMIGSRGKVGRFQKRLSMRGIDPGAWAAVHAPIGLDLGAETPAEIAVAIAAELVALRHRRRGAFAGWTPR